MPRPYQSDVTAIVIALEPDETMNGRARAANAMLRAGYPEGFLLDADHRPHMSIYAGFVRTGDLEAVCEAFRAVIENEPYTSWKLKARRYQFTPLDAAYGLAGIAVDPTLGLIRMQQDMIDAAAPYAVRFGTAAAFSTTASEPDIHPAVIDYVTHFADHTGKNFRPHVTVGVAATDYLDALLKQPFEAFAFSPASASVYQIADYGAARRAIAVLPTPARETSRLTR